MYEIFEKLLKANEVKASEVAKALGFQRSVFSDWKNGRSKPKMDKMKQIADYFGVSLDYLCFGEAPTGYYINEETAKIAQDIFENRELKALYSLIFGSHKAKKAL